MFFCFFGMRPGAHGIAAWAWDRILKTQSRKWGSGIITFKMLVCNAERFVAQGCFLFAFPRESILVKDLCLQTWQTKQLSLDVEFFIERARLKAVHVVGVWKPMCLVVCFSRALSSKHGKMPYLLLRSWPTAKQNATCLKSKNRRQGSSLWPRLEKQIGLLIEKRSTTPPLPIFCSALASVFLLLCC